MITTEGAVTLAWCIFWSRALISPEALARHERAVRDAERVVNETFDAIGPPPGWTPSP